MMSSLRASTTTLPAGIGGEHRIFGFESDFADDLRCIPMVVRFKLDRCGVKLSLRQWSKMGQTNRSRLLAQRCDSAAEVEVYKTLVVTLATTHSSEQIKWLQVDPEPAWGNVLHVPSDVVRQADMCGVLPPSQYAWSKLSVLGRFALLKLARSDHDNHNFEPAMREMDLI